MKLGICVPHYGRPIEVDRMLAVVRRAEEAGLDSVWVTDHVIVPRDIDIIYREDMLDPLAVLSWLAGVTERVSLGTNIVPPAVVTAGVVTFFGLPVTGFMIRTFANGGLTCGTASCQGNYGALFTHSFTTLVSP